MAKILDANGSITSIDSIILEAKKYIILVSPFWDCPKNVILSLLGALKNGVKVVIFCRPTQKNGKEKTLPIPRESWDYFRRFEEKGLFVVISDNLDSLHSKLYLNENKCLITSLNMYDYSVKKNIELGIELSWIDEHDKELKRFVMRHLNEICEKAGLDANKPIIADAKL
jgi:phosphatidylserine/phosphatidylglycerophosphate/cardiolipin synthase-like enzyme